MDTFSNDKLNFTYYKWETDLEELKSIVSTFLNS
jgi:hypothetical protein